MESGHLCFVRVHVLSLNIALEIQRAPLILTQDDNTSLCASSIGNQSRVNPGGLSEMSQRISVYLCVVHVQRSLRKVPEQSVVICPDGDVPVRVLESEFFSPTPTEHFNRLMIACHFVIQ